MSSVRKENKSFNNILHTTRRFQVVKIRLCAIERYHLINQFWPRRVLQIISFPTRFFLELAT